MRRALLVAFVAFFAQCAAFGALAAQSEDPGGDGVICYRGDEGFIIGMPGGWANLPEDARQLGLCAVYAPSATDFHSAPALIYPRVLPLDAKAANQVDVMVTDLLALFHSTVGGQGASVEEGTSVTSDAGLIFELRYLNNGPAGNDFELMAYHVGRDTMLLLVLSAITEENRLAAMPDFVRVLKSVHPITVNDQTGK